VKLSTENVFTGTFMTCCINAKTTLESTPPLREAEWNLAHQMKPHRLAQQSLTDPDAQRN
jgi:hypothetical protein